MKNKYSAIVLALGLVVSTCGSVTASSTNEAVLNSLAQQAVSENTNISASAIGSLRGRGPVGLQALLDANVEILRQYQTSAVGAVPLERRVAWQRLQAALTGVSGQRDCQASRLYWYTDFDQAKAAAKAGGKPILSLRLLGKLDEEYSCANSRFFRTTLYANAEVSQFLRDHFILHWKSVRPVPRITVDFGDGRKIERTITGNSVHYVLDADGRVIDALPGLYGPRAFLKGLADAEQAALQSGPLRRHEQDQYLRNYHDRRYAAILQNWSSDLTAVGCPATKSFQSADDATWMQIAKLHADDAGLDMASKALISSKYPNAIDAGRVAAGKFRVENPLVTTLRNLQRSIAEDTVRNEYLLHSQIHQWLGRITTPPDVDQLNTKVYTELFLTPDSDPWLGLVPANTFTGLENNGLVQAATAH